MDARALRPGIVVHDRYLIRKILGAGGFGITYQVQDLKENSVLAMKEYMPKTAAVRASDGIAVGPKFGYQEHYERYRAKFLEEAKTIYQYRHHPNISRVLHLFYENNTAYYCMEYLEGMDFARHLERRGGRMSWEELCPLMEQVVYALEIVHKNNIIHCDISPDNIFIQKNGIVKVIDFGAAKKVMNSPYSTLFAKADYAPPEQFSYNGKLGPWTDIYALAVMIYRAYTGMLPPGAETRLTIDRIQSPREMGMAVPSRQWDQALMKALELRHENRYQDIRCFWEDLNEGVSADKIPGMEFITEWTGNKWAAVKRFIKDFVPEKEAVKSYEEEGPEYPALEGIRGYYAGRRVIPSGEMYFGTNQSRCQVWYPKDCRQIGEVQLCLWKEEEKLFLMDVGSGFASFINGKRLLPGLVHELRENDQILLGEGELFRTILTETG